MLQYGGMKEYLVIMPKSAEKYPPLSVIFYPAHRHIPVALHRALGIFRRRVIQIKRQQNTTVLNRAKLLLAINLVPDLKALSLKRRVQRMIRLIILFLSS